MKINKKDNSGLMTSGFCDLKTSGITKDVIKQYTNAVHSKLVRKHKREYLDLTTKLEVLRERFSSGILLQKDKQDIDRLLGLE